MNKKLCFIVLASILTIFASVFTGCDKDDDDANVAITAALTSYEPALLVKGAEIKFIGTNLDVVTSIVFPENITITTFTQKSKTEIKAIVPLEAVVGYITLKFPGGDVKTATEIAFAEPTVTPSVTSITPITAIKAGADLTLTGTDLDAIAKILFTGGTDITTTGFTVNEAKTELVVAVPANAKDGKIKYYTEAGVVAETAEVITLVKPAITSFDPASIVAGTNFTIEGTDLDLVTSVLIGEIACEIVEKTETTINVKSTTAASTGKVIVKAENGDSATSTDDITVTGTITPLPAGVLWQGTNDFGVDWDASLSIVIDPSKFEGATGIKVELTADATTASWWKIKMTLNDADWTPLDLPLAVEGTVDISRTQTSYTFDLDGENLTNVLANGLVFGGESIIVTKISLVDLLPALPDGVLWEGDPFSTGYWSNGLLAVDGGLIAAAGPGNYKIEFTTDETVGEWALKLMYNSSWFIVPGFDTEPFRVTNTEYNFTLSGEAFDIVAANTLSIGGAGVFVTKVSFVGPAL